jgi:hypothetical protein
MGLLVCSPRDVDTTCINAAIAWIARSQSEKCGSLIKVELRPGAHSAPTLTPLVISPELSFVSKFVVTFDDTVAAVGEREDESTQICTFKISTTRNVEELQVWLLSETDEVCIDVLNFLMLKTSY